MSKYKFTAEYELRASPKMLFPYVSTASGLSQWFASKVNVMPDQMYDFIWDNESHPARMATIRQNKSVKFDFLPTDDEREHAYVEFRLDVSELTQSTFLKVTDYSNNSDADDLRAVWNGLLDSLREIVGS